MERRRLGRTGLEIAPIVLGGNVFGWTADEKTSFSILDGFLDAGFNAIDTADAYSRWAPGHTGGESETIIGDWMKRRGNREKVVVITKVGSEMGPRLKGLSAGYVGRAVDASLKRLKVDVIDLYLSHWPDSSVPYEETLTAFEKLLDNGKVRAIGASNLDAGQLKQSLDAAKKAGLHRYDVLEPEYNLYDRAAFDGPLRDLCIAEDIGIITYFSLAKGFLSGKYRGSGDLGQSQRGEGIGAYLNPRGMRILDALDELAKRHGAKPAEVALAWAIAQPGVTAPIASVTSLAQLDSLTRAATLALSSDDLEKLDRASAVDVQTS